MPLLEVTPDEKNGIQLWNVGNGYQGRSWMSSGRNLSEYGISLSDVADNCPGRTRTLRACHKVLEAAREPSQAAGTPDTEPQTSHCGAGRAVRRIQKDHGTAPDVSGCHFAGLYQRI